MRYINLCFTYLYLLTYSDWQRDRLG